MGVRSHLHRDGAPQVLFIQVSRCLGPCAQHFSSIFPYFRLIFFSMERVQKDAHSLANTPSYPLKMASRVQCSSCLTFCRDRSTLRQHVYRKHAEPIPFTLPSGAIEQFIVKADGRYQCWCAQTFSNRDGCITHVGNLHVRRTDWPILLFRMKNGEFYSHRFRHHSHPIQGSAGEDDGENALDVPEAGPPAPAPAPSPSPQGKSLLTNSCTTTKQTLTGDVDARSVKLLHGASKPSTKKSEPTT